MSRPPWWCPMQMAALVAFRVVQEGLTNVVRHVGTDTSATVALAATETLLTVTVSNTGEAESRRDRVAAVSPGSGLAAELAWPNGARRSAEP